MRAFSIAPFGHGEEMWVVRREELREYYVVRKTTRPRLRRIGECKRDLGHSLRGYTEGASSHRWMA